ncbi:DUF1330 domain-containing protein [Lyngbya confervoides]|uniref:DUF1330 domain-containing protein n=1 Tax=Lyngbya confervoides BDU141951 TaxID=1574623 RepID=A0ABD4SZE7_9CYAN|nr:DUF1330 domain-containing protein [Lyngbya confervoides]MCM1981638.1 DUF1330 domain-containing protein [Lyngbya confervoides BDU141951]
MSVFMVIEADIQDEDRFSAYASATLKLVIQFGGRYRVLGGSKTFLEGNWGKTKVVISEWPSMEAAEAFWNSEEYAEIKKLRSGIADCKVMLAETLAEEKWIDVVRALDADH